MNITTNGNALVFSDADKAKLIIPKGSFSVEIEDQRVVLSLIGTTTEIYLGLDTSVDGEMFETLENLGVKLSSFSKGGGDGGGVAQGDLDALNNALQGQISTISDRVPSNVTETPSLLIRNGSSSYYMECSIKSIMGVGSNAPVSGILYFDDVSGVSVGSYGVRTPAVELNLYGNGVNLNGQGGKVYLGGTGVEIAPKTGKVDILGNAGGVDIQGQSGPVKINGNTHPTTTGAPGQALVTDGTGVLSWASILPGIPETGTFTLKAIDGALTWVSEE